MFICIGPIIFFLKQNFSDLSIYVRKTNQFDPAQIENTDFTKRRAAAHTKLKWNLFLPYRVQTSNRRVTWTYLVLSVKKGLAPYHSLNYSKRQHEVPCLSPPVSRICLLQSWVFSFFWICCKLLPVERCSFKRLSGTALALAQ